MKSVAYSSHCCHWLGFVSHLGDLTNLSVSFSTYFVSSTAALPEYKMSLGALTSVMK